MFYNNIKYDIYKVSLKELNFPQHPHSTTLQKMSLIDFHNTFEMSSKDIFVVVSPECPQAPCTRSIRRRISLLVILAPLWPRMTYLDDFYFGTPSWNCWMSFLKRAEGCHSFQPRMPAERHCAPRGPTLRGVVRTPRREW